MYRRYVLFKPPKFCVLTQNKHSDLFKAYTKSWWLHLELITNFNFFETSGFGLIDMYQKVLIWTYLSDEKGMWNSTEQELSMNTCGCCSQYNKKIKVRYYSQVIKTTLIKIFSNALPLSMFSYSRIFVILDIYKSVMKFCPLHIFVKYNL